jgi:general L-amino acid transport system permease protein
MLFGAFPFDQHWRAALACLVILAGAIVSAVPRFWSWRLALVWAALLTVVMWLMLGGAGLAPTRADDWGGLPLTLILFAGSVTGGLPLAIMLALGRYSRLPVLRLLCVGFIEIFRGLPLLAVLFMASLMLPLVLGDGITIGKVARAMLAMTLFFAAYAAEIVRGGLQALPRGQTEAAQSVGLSYWQMMALVILPQALKLVAPALVNDIIRAFKNTSFVAVIGLFDLLGATRAAIEDPQWVRYALETYLFLILVYFLFCSSMSAYARWIERRIDVDSPATARAAP